MVVPEAFEISGERGYFRPAAEVTLDQAVQMVGDAIVYARSRSLRELLVNIIGLTGFGPPTISQRYFIVEGWVAAARGQLRLAVACRPELIDPNKFGVTVAVNRGLDADVFSSESQAEAWLDGRRS